MDSRSNNIGSGRIRPPPAVPDVSFEEAVLRAKVAQICDHVGYHAITKDSTNILVDIYRRTFVHLARHCKEAANNNRRTEPTFVDLIQAYDFVGISINELKDHIENVKLPFNVKIEQDERKPSNRIQRNLMVDDLLEAEKNTQLEDQDEAVDKAMSDSGIEEEEKPTVPLLREVYQDISKEFPNPSTPVKADKAKIKREEKPAIPRLKITPLDPSIAEPPSFLPILENIKQDLPKVATNRHSTSPSPLVSGSGSKRKLTGPSKTKGKTKLKTKIKTKTKTKTRTKNKTKTKLEAKIKTKPKTKTKTSIPSPTLQDLPPPSPPIPISAPVTIRQPTPVATPSPLPPPPAPPATTRTPTPTIAHAPAPTPPPSKQASTSKQPKTKKKKNKSANSQFAIVTETVPAAEEPKEWLCPTCGAPDDGDLMVGCDSCEAWYHLRCTNLKEAPPEDARWDCAKCQVQKDATPAVDLCPECNLPDDGTLMIQCEDPFCAKWFHGKCVNALAPSDDESWFCKACVEKQQSAFQRRRRAK